MSGRHVLAALFLASAALAAEEPRYSVTLKNAMLHEPKTVDVIIHWRPGQEGKSHRLGRAVTREIPMFGLTAARLPRKKVESLARSRLVERIYFDSDAGGSDGKETEATAPTQLDRDEKGAGATWGVQAVRAPKVWDELKVTGKRVRVGIVDSGIDARCYPGRVALFRDFTTQPSAQPTDPLGHGTHVAGTIGGGTLTGNVRFGIAPDCTYVIGRAINAQNTLTSSQGIAALAWVTDPDGNPATNDGARVVNCSFSNFPKVDDELWRACINRLHARNVFAVFSAANNGGEGTVGSPGVLSESFTIGAVGPDFKRWEGSSYGHSRLGNRPRGFLKPDLMGPGVDTLSLSALNVPRRMTGTSMATPHVVGVAALMFEANPRLTVKEAREILEDSAIEVSDRWKSPQCGAGMADAYAAVKKARALYYAGPHTPTIAELLAQGDAAVEANNLPRAVDRYIAVINTVGGDLSPEPAQRAMVSLSLAYAKQGNYRAAANGLRKYLEVFPKGLLAADAQLELGLAYRRTSTANQGESVRAQALAAEELAKFAKAAPAHERLGEALMERCYALSDSGQLDACKQQIAEILEKFADRPEISGPARELAQELDGQTADPLGE